MLLDNRTPAPAIFQCADFDTDERYAVVIWKLTYDLPSTASGPWRLSSDPMPISGDPLETAFGVFHGDIFLRKAGVDLCILGRVRRTRPVASTNVTLRCGAFTHTLRVTGDRVWESAGGRLVPSKPVPFTEMDLSYERAFGGVAAKDGMLVPYPDNPVGRGYYLDRADAVGKPLPNIEAEKGPRVLTWEDRPAPAGWGLYPMHWGLRARSSVTIDPALGIVTGISPAAFNNAHPELVLPAIAPGERLELTGVLDQRVLCSLPHTTGNVRVRVGDHTFDVPTVIDGVYLWLDASRLVITQRANFNYVVRPEEARAATLTVLRA